MAAKKVITDLDLGQNRLINPVIDPRTSLPLTPVVGQTCYHSTAGIFVGWDGNAWRPISPSVSNIPPSSPVPGQKWLRTTDNVMFYRNSSNTQWFSEGTFSFGLAINSKNVNITGGVFFKSTAGTTTSVFPIPLPDNITITGIITGTDNTNGPWFFQIGEAFSPWNPIHTIVVPGTTNYRRINLNHRIEVASHSKITMSALSAFGTISPKTYAGSGLDDLSTSGTYIGTGVKNYIVQIDSVGGTDTFRWSQDGGTTFIASNVPITGSTQTLSDGVSITFGATTGHQLSSAWYFSGFTGTTTSIRRPRVDIYYRISV